MTRYLTLIIAMALASCAGPAPGTPEAQLMAMQRVHEAQVEHVKGTVDDMPSWYLNTRLDDVSLYGTGTAVSGDVGFAMDKAVLQAKNAIARRISSKISSEMKDYMADIGQMDNPVTMQKAERAVKEVVTEAEIIGYNVTASEIRPAGPVFRAYAMVQYPLGDANRMLIDRIRHDAELSLKSDASKTFADLEKEIQAARSADRP